MDKGTEEIFYAVRAVLGALYCGQEVAPPVNARTSPSQGRDDREALPPPTWLHGTREPLTAAWGVSEIRTCCSQVQGRRTAGSSPDVTVLGQGRNWGGGEEFCLCTV